MMSNLSMQASLPPAASQDQPRVTFLTERNTLRVASVILLLLAWQIAGMMTDPYILPTPVEVAVAWWQLTVSGELITAAGASVFVFILGFAIGAGAWHPAGHRNRSVAAAARFLRHLRDDLLVDAVDRAPTAAWWCGSGLHSRPSWCWSSFPRSGRW